MNSDARITIEAENFTKWTVLEGDEAPAIILRFNKNQDALGDWNDDKPTIEFAFQYGKTSPNVHIVDFEFVRCLKSICDDCLKTVAREIDRHDSDVEIKKETEAESAAIIPPYGMHCGPAAGLSPHIRFNDVDIPDDATVTFPSVDRCPCGCGNTPNDLKEFSGPTHATEMIARNRTGKVIYDEDHDWILLRTYLDFSDDRKQELDDLLRSRAEALGITTTNADRNA